MAFKPNLTGGQTQSIAEREQKEHWQEDFG